jgi:glyoxylase I family protein
VDRRTSAAGSRKAQTVICRHFSLGGKLGAGTAVEKVTGIGGVFFRARQPKALAEWYRDHLGVNVVPDNYDDPPWQQQAGPTVYAPFPEDTSYFGDGGKQWMINFPVVNLDAIVAQLRTAGISVEIDSEPYPNGRFARLYEPEGNAIELWKPTGRDGTPGAQARK